MFNESAAEGRMGLFVSALGSPMSNVPLCCSWASLSVLELLGRCSQRKCSLSLSDLFKYTLMNFFNS